MLKIKYMICFGISFALLGCGNTQDLRKQAEVQSEQEQISQNKNKEAWAKRLKEDIAQRRAFLNSLLGEWEGQLSVGDEDYSLRILFTANLPDYDTDRVASLEELEFELQNLSLNIQVGQWNPRSQVAMGCVFENINPDMKNGKLFLLSESCTTSYEIFLSNKSSKQGFSDTAKYIAEQIRQGEEIDILDSLVGKLRSTANASIREFRLERSR